RRSNSAGKLHISASAPAEKRSRLKSLESATDASVILRGADDKLGRELKEFRSFGAQVIGIDASCLRGSPPSGDRGRGIFGGEGDRRTPATVAPCRRSP